MAERSRLSASAHAPANGDGHFAWRNARTPAAELAAYVLWSTTVDPGGLLRRLTVLMSKHWMDKVWSWDHCFNALALAASEPRTGLAPVPATVRPSGPGRDTARLSRLLRGPAQLRQAAAHPRQGARPPDTP